MHSCGPVALSYIAIMMRDALAMNTMMEVKAATSRMISAMSYSPCSLCFFFVPFSFSGQSQFRRICRDVFPSVESWLIPVAGKS
jgi:hypothetical protein